MSGELIVTVEGHGEVAAAASLVSRVLKAQGSAAVFPSVPTPVRFKIDAPGQLETACEYARSKRPAGLLITSDWEDGEPCHDAPRLAARIRGLDLPFPAAIVLFFREYETLAISVADKLSGKELQVAKTRPVTLADAKPLPDPEVPRDAKGWVGKNLMGGRSYKPTLHQLPLTRLMQPADLRAADLPSFRRLERALNHLVRHAQAGTSGVYPPREQA
ncbi:hypothetical protein [Kineococcus sp. R86509]|uniref:hypothetical protein n=1 Tax=Kineococcus sp. R86509 TaxID=3093851 RepID=UPI0036D27F85